MLDDLFAQIDQAKLLAKTPEFAQAQQIRRNNEREAIKLAQESHNIKEPHRQPFFTMVGRFGKEFSPPGFLGPTAFDSLRK